MISLLLLGAVSPDPPKRVSADNQSASSVGSLHFLEALAIGQAVKADDQVVRLVALASLPLLAAVGARLYVALDLTVGGWREHRLIVLVVDPDGLTTAVRILNDTVNVPVHLIVK